MARDAWSHLAPITSKSGQGSSAELWFQDPADLQKARLVVRALRRSYLDGRVVWLDARRERAENLPVRNTHTLPDAIKEAGINDVVKDIPGRTVRAAGPASRTLSRDECVGHRQPRL